MKGGIDKGMTKDEAVARLTDMTERYPMDVGQDGMAPMVMKRNVANLYDYLTARGLRPDGRRRATPGYARGSTNLVVRGTSMSKPVCVVWMNEAKVYEQALTRAGLTDKFELHTLKLDEKLTDDLAERTEILVGWRAGSHLRRMPRLRWIQAMTAGVERWLGASRICAPT